MGEFFNTHAFERISGGGLMANKTYHKHNTAEREAYDILLIDNGDGTYSEQVVVKDHQPPVTTPAVYNVTLVAADTEYPQALSANTREFRFRCRTLFDVRYAFVTGKVATPTAPYLTLPGGSDYWSDNDNLASTTLYFASDEAGVVVEIEEWV